MVSWSENRLLVVWVLIQNTVGTENMLPCKVSTSRTTSEVAANVERSCFERRAKLLRTSSEVASNVERSCFERRAKLLRTSSEVAANVERSCCERRAKLLRTCSEVEALLRSCTHSVQVRISLWQ